MFILGLTGSVGMGKSTTARFFAEEGVPVHDADAVVHRLYEGEAAAAIEAAFPGTTVGGKVDRAKLAARVLDDPAALKQLEAIVHPLVHAGGAPVPGRRGSAWRQGRPAGHPACSMKPAAKTVPMRWWSCRRRPRSSARACWNGPE